MKFEKTQRTPLVEIGSNSCLIKVNVIQRILLSGLAQF